MTCTGSARWRPSATTHIDVAGAVAARSGGPAEPSHAQGVVAAAVGHLNELLDDRLVLEVLRIDEVCPSQRGTVMRSDAPVAPIASARERLSGLVSIAMILLAFRAAAPWITARPTQPTGRLRHGLWSLADAPPKTAVVSPCCTLAVLVAAP